MGIIDSDERCTALSGKRCTRDWERGVLTPLANGRARGADIRLAGIEAWGKSFPTRKPSRGYNYPRRFYGFRAFQDQGARRRHKSAAATAQESQAVTTCPQMQVRTRPQMEVRSCAQIKIFAVGQNPIRKPRLWPKIAAPISYIYLFSDPTCSRISWPLQGCSTLALRPLTR